MANNGWKKYYLCKIINRVNKSMVIFHWLNMKGIIMGRFKLRIKDIDQINKELEDRFSYLPKEERNKLIYGDDFVPVPKQELKRLRIDSYPYLM